MNGLKKAFTELAIEFETTDEETWMNISASR